MRGLTAERVRELLGYNPRSGILKWLPTRGRTYFAGKSAGYEAQGCLKLEIDGRCYMVHDVVWLHFYGTAPQGRIDHLDLNRTNNRISNLRDVPDHRRKSFTDVPLTADRLRDLLTYDQDTGLFRWKVARGASRKKPTHCVSGTSGYVVIRVDRRLYRAHRLAWLYVYGKWPSKNLDHINGDRADNRIANLREANGTQNNGNTKLHSTNTSGYRGVVKDRDRPGWWKAQISKNNRNVGLGSYPTKEEAFAVYMRGGQGILWRVLSYSRTGGGNSESCLM